MIGSRRITPVLLVLAIVMTAAALSGCAGKSATAVQPPAASVSVAPPTIEILEPAADAVVGAGDIAVSVKTTGLKFVMPSNTVVPGEGHVHFTLDDQPFKMSTSPEYVYAGVTPGPHTLNAELVQNDTTSFDPPVEQQITFTAK